MACFFVVMAVLLCCTSGSPVPSNHEQTKESSFSPEKVSIDIFCLFFKPFHNNCWSWIYLSPTFFFQQGRGFHCWHRRCWGRIQGDRGEPKQASRIVWSSRSTWSGSQRHLTRFQTSNFQFSAISANFFFKKCYVYMKRQYLERFIYNASRVVTQVLKRYKRRPALYF